MTLSRSEDHPRHAGNITDKPDASAGSEDHPRHAGNMRILRFSWNFSGDHPRHAGNISPSSITEKP